MEKQKKFMSDILKEFEEMKNKVGLEERTRRYIYLKEKLTNFVRIILKDSERLKEIKDMDRIPLPSNLWMFKEDYQIKEKFKTLNIKQGIMLRIINAIIHEIELRSEFKEDIEKIDRKIEKAKKEAERRKNVLSSKTSGRAMEMIQRQKEELKEKEKKIKELEKKTNPTQT